jgi:hypothetical protein
MRSAVDQGSYTTKFRQNSINIEHDFSDRFSMSLLVGDSESTNENMGLLADFIRLDSGQGVAGNDYFVYDDRAGGDMPFIDFGFDVADPNNWDFVKGYSALRAFRTDAPETIAFAEGATPAVADQAIAFLGQPEFRQAEITGLPQIDVAQTQMPEEWRALPIYRWETNTPFQLVERVRGLHDRGRPAVEALAVCAQPGCESPERLRVERGRMPLNELGRRPAPGRSRGRSRLGGADLTSSGRTSAMTLVLRVEGCIEAAQRGARVGVDFVASGAR